MKNIEQSTLIFLIIQKSVFFTIPEARQGGAEKTGFYGYNSSAEF